MRIDPAFHHAAPDPVDRLIHVHARSLAKARRQHQRSEVAPACREADARQCRIVINALRREIDRLLRGIDRFACCAPDCHPSNSAATHPTADDDAGTAEFARLASPPTERKLYAVSPLGRIDPSQSGAVATGAASAMQAGPLPGHPAGLGRLIDTLA